MGFRTGSFAKIWEVEDKERSTRVRMSISRKNKETGEYDQEFNGYCSLIGTAHAKAQRLKRGDRIRLGDVDVTNTYDKEKGREFVNYKCFSFEFADDLDSSSGGSRGDGASRGKPVESNPFEGDTSDESSDIPF